MVEEMEAAQVQRLGDIDKLERSGITKRVNQREEELQLMSQAQVWDNRTVNGLM